MSPHLILEVKRIDCMWLIHRMIFHRLQKIVLYGELSTGHRDKGAPRKRYKDTMKRYLATCNIDHHQWTTHATNRMNWRRTVYQSTTSFETTQRVNVEDKRRRRKNKDLLNIIMQTTDRAETWMAISIGEHHTVWIHGQSVYFINYIYSCRVITMLDLTHWVWCLISPGIDIT